MTFLKSLKIERGANSLEIYFGSRVLWFEVHPIGNDMGLPCFAIAILPILGNDAGR